MKINSIVNRYIFLEMIQPFVINLVFLSFVFLMTRILNITNLIVNYRIGMSTVLLMLIYSMPFFLEFVIPMSVMLAVLLTFLRMSSDNEIVALKAGGLSVYRLLPPVIFFCLMGWVLTSFMAIYGLPKGRLSLKDLSLKIASSNFDIGLKERTFNDNFKGVVLYVNKIDLKDKTLRDVFIEDQRSEKTISTVMAPRGRLYSDPGKLSFQLRLFNGTVNQVDLENRAAHSIHFDTYDIILDLKKMMTDTRTGPKDEEEMSLSELRRFIRGAPKKDDKYYLAVMEFHKKFSIPFSCFALGILAVPLGIQAKSARRSYGIGLGLIFFLIYYMLLSAGWVFGEAGTYPPLIGMWVPNIVMGGLGLFLLIRTANERSLKENPLVSGIIGIGSRFFPGKKKAGRRFDASNCCTNPLAPPRGGKTPSDEQPKQG